MVKQGGTSNLWNISPQTHPQALQMQRKQMKRTAFKPRKGKTWKKLDKISKSPHRRAKLFIPQSVRDEVMERSGEQCEVMDAGYRCGYTGQHMHHLKPKGRGGKNTVDNLKWICAVCHAYIHQNPKCAEEMGLLIK